MYTWPVGKNDHLREHLNEITLTNAVCVGLVAFEFAFVQFDRDIYFVFHINKKAHVQT